MKKILKGILLWATALTIMLFIGGIDSIVDKGLGVTLAWIAICIVLYYLCRANTICVVLLCLLESYTLYQDISSFIN